MLKMSEQYCKKHDLNVKLKYGLATGLPFPDRSFDYVLSMSMLHHLNNNDRAKALGEINRVLKYDGKALITVWNKLQKRFLFRKRDILLPWRIHEQVYQRYYHLFTPWELQKLLQKTGFKILKKNVFGRNLMFVAGK